MACLLVNPSVKQEIENTADADRRGNLTEEFNEFEFTPYNATVFPFESPANLPEKGKSDLLETSVDEFPEFRKNQKIFLDALSNSKVDILLTTKGLLGFGTVEY